MDPPGETKGELPAPASYGELGGFVLAVFLAYAIASFSVNPEIMFDFSGDLGGVVRLAVWALPALIGLAAFTAWRLRGQPEAHAAAARGSGPGILLWAGFVFILAAAFADFCLGNHCPPPAWLFAAGVTLSQALLCLGAVLLGASVARRLPPSAS